MIACPRCGTTDPPVPQTSTEIGRLVKTGPAELAFVADPAGKPIKIFLPGPPVCPVCQLERPPVGVTHSVEITIQQGSAVTLVENINVRHGKWPWRSVLVFPAIVPSKVIEWFAGWLSTTPDLTIRDAEAAAKNEFGGGHGLIKLLRDLWRARPGHRTTPGRRPKR